MELFAMDMDKKAGAFSHLKSAWLGLRKNALLGCILLATLAINPATSWGRGHTDSDITTQAPSIPRITLSDLPPEGQVVFSKIHTGAPFQYEKDGTVFGNRERLLPENKRGFYHEYTVPTPKLTHRGARRIVCGGLKPKQPEACYYTKDHYRSFNLITQ